MNIAVLIAVEDYSDLTPPVKYAKADALALAGALEQLNFDSNDQLLLLNEKATKAAINSRVRKVLASLTHEDTLYFCYAGHGFSKNGSNYLTCYDSQLSDLAATSVELDWLFKLFRECECKRIVMFLDSGGNGLSADADLRGAHSHLADDELKEFFSTAEHCVCFAACTAGQESWPSGQLKHGVWTYHLIEALSGEAPLAIERQSLVTSSSLQNYLEQAVPKSLRAAYTQQKIQSPAIWGARSSDFIIADLSEVLAKRRAASNPNAGQMAQVSLIAEQSMNIKSLSGFHAGHQVPKIINDAASEFVAKISTEQVREDLNDIHGKLKQAFRFKRTELQIDIPEDGAGTIITPYFSYSIAVCQSPDHASKALWSREIHAIKEADEISSEAFEQAFGKTFSILALSPSTEIDVPALIDRIEELDDDLISIDYDTDATSCTLRFDGVEGRVHVTADAFRIVHDGPRSPQQLVQSLFAIQSLLADAHQFRLIPFDA